MTFYGIHLVDHLVIVAYLLGITTLGVWMGRRVHNLETFFQGGRRFGRALMVMFAFGAGTHSDHAVGVSAKTYTNGLSGIWYQWLWLFGTPFYWLIAPIVRRMRALTNADYFELRYGRGMAVLYLAGAVVGRVDRGLERGMALRAFPVSALFASNHGGQRDRSHHLCSLRNCQIPDHVGRKAGPRRTRGDSLRGG